MAKPIEHTPIIAGTDSQKVRKDIITSLLKKPSERKRAELSKEIQEMRKCREYLQSITVSGRPSL